ncbi:MAG TPA: hypothetical protein VMH39_14620 [Gemmatimonadaceae bacterium]|nr:hypothetical protein [Gemmatimonadaceae bacterium]
MKEPKHHIRVTAAAIALATMFTLAPTNTAWAAAATTTGCSSSAAADCQAAATSAGVSEAAGGPVDWLDVQAQAAACMASQGINAADCSLQELGSAVWGAFAKIF